MTKEFGASLSWFKFCSLLLHSEHLSFPDLYMMYAIFTAFYFSEGYTSLYTLWKNRTHRRTLCIYPVFLAWKSKFIRRYKCIPKLEKTTKENEMSDFHMYYLLVETHCYHSFQMTFLRNSLIWRKKPCLSFLWYELLRISVYLTVYKQKSLILNSLYLLYGNH